MRPLNLGEGDIGKTDDARNSEMYSRLSRRGAKPGRIMGFLFVGPIKSFGDRIFKQFIDLKIVMICHETGIRFVTKAPDHNFRITAKSDIF